MRILVLNTDYGAFLKSLYGGHPGLAVASYDEQQRVRADSLFAVADFFSANMQALGHEAIDIHANNESMQLAWAREHSPGLVGVRQHSRRGDRILGGGCRLDRILAAQIEAFRPDVILNQDIRSINLRLLAGAKRDGALLVGQHGATTFTDLRPLRVYDLVVSQVGPTVDAFRTGGIAAEELRLAFEPSILDRLSSDHPLRDVVFVGSLFPGVHDARIKLLERICSEVADVSVWSGSVEHLAPSSPIRDRFRGQAWGREMYEIFRRARIVLNQHGGTFAYADNCRLYEATGAGALLLTDDLPNLPELFVPGEEVAVYGDADTCLGEITRLLGDEDGRARVAASGQQRTLRTHTYRERMAQLIEILQPLARSRGI